MKNPKDKAEELFLKFRQIPPCSHYTGVGDGEAKQCALLMVDEIINCDSFFKTLEDTKAFTKYWYDVQQEINKL